MFAVKYIKVENSMEYAWFNSRSDARMFLKLVNVQENEPHSEIVEVDSVCGSPLCN